MRILSWNILHGGGVRREGILQAIAAIDPDLLTLQEVRRGDGPDPLLEGLAELGLVEQALSPVADARSNGLLIASRWPLEAEPLLPPATAANPDAVVHLLRARVSWPEAEAPLRMVAVRFPQKQAQIPQFEALLSLPADWREACSLLIGDFNCGIPLLDSQTRTFPCTAWFQRLLAQGWIDSWRRRHPQEREYSWFSSSRGNGFRYDHALVSAALDRRIATVRYLQELRAPGFSDHAGVLLEIG